MAERRMFAKTIVLSDAFLDMPLSARCLYFTLNMFADDEGFINNPKSIIRQCGASTDDMNILILKKFVIPFEDEGIIVIKHWKIHNLIQNDRFKETKYKALRNQLYLDENRSYTVTDPNRIQIVSKTEAQNSIDKNSKEKNKFIPPTLEEIAAYCKERQNNVNAKKFYEYYSVAGWKDAKGNPVKNWKQKMIANWEKEKPKAEETVPVYNSQNNEVMNEEEEKELLKLMGREQ